MVQTKNDNNKHVYPPLNAPVTFVVTDLVYTGTIVEGMWVTGVVHETSNITGGVGCLQEFNLYIHLIELHREEKSVMLKV